MGYVDRRGRKLDYVLYEPETALPEPGSAHRRDRDTPRCHGASPGSLPGPGVLSWLARGAGQDTARHREYGRYPGRRNVQELDWPARRASRARTSVSLVIAGHRGFAYPLGQ